MWMLNWEMSFGLAIYYLSYTSRHVTAFTITMPRLSRVGVYTIVQSQLFMEDKPSFGSIIEKFFGLLRSVSYISHILYAFSFVKKQHNLGKGVVNYSFNRLLLLMCS